MKKASELIREIQESIDMYGDLEIKIRDSIFGYIEDPNCCHMEKPEVVKTIKESFLYIG